MTSQLDERFCEFCGEETTWILDGGYWVCGEHFRIDAEPELQELEDDDEVIV